MEFKDIKYLKKELEAKSIERKVINSKDKRKLKVKANYKLPLNEFIQSIAKYNLVTRKKLLNQYIKIKKSIKATRQAAAEGTLGKSALSPLQRMELLELFGKLYPMKEIHGIINDEWGVKYSMNALSQFKKNNLEEIKRKQDLTIRDYSKLRLAHKRPRLEELTDLYNIAKDKGFIETSVKILDQINKEVEKNQVEVMVSGEVNINQAVKVHSDIGLENIKGLATMRVLAMLNDAQRSRINRKLIGKSNDVGFLGLSKVVGVEEITQGDDEDRIDLEAIRNAEFEEVPDEVITPEPVYKIIKKGGKSIKVKVKSGAEHYVNSNKQSADMTETVNDENVGEKGATDEVVDALKKLMRKKIEKRRSQLDGVDTNVSKREIEDRGDEA